MLSKPRIGNYQLDQSSLLGSGSYSSVYLAESLHTSSDKAAVKKVKKTTNNLIPYKMAKREAKILSKLHSKYFCELLGTHEDNNYFYMIQRYQDGDALSKILKNRHKLPCKQALDIFEGIVAGLEYLLSRRVMHRDLKPANILVGNKNAIKIIDLGFASKITQQDQRTHETRVGTPLYMSPELLNREKYNSKSDIWSLGVMLFEMLYGVVPYAGREEQQILTRIRKGRRSVVGETYISDDAGWLMEGCLKVRVQERMEWRELWEWRRQRNLPEVRMEGEKGMKWCMC